MATEDLDPFGNYYFSFELDGVEVAHFMEFSGLKTAAEVYEIQEGGLNSTTHKLPSGSKYENLTLRYATHVSQQLAEWRDKYINDEFGLRKDCSGAVVMRNNKGEEIRRYSFHECWPVSWEGPSMASGGSALAIESVEIAYDGLYLDGTEPPEPPEPQPPEPVPEPETPLATEPIPFEFDSDEMKPGGEEACDRVDAAIREQDPVPEIVWIEAHTCTMGTYAYNLSLSNQRAQATRAEMEERNPDITYRATGFSYTYPVASNLNDAGRQANRRSEFYDSSPESRGRFVHDPGGKPSGP